VLGIRRESSNSDRGGHIAVGGGISDPARQEGSEASRDRRWVRAQAALLLPCRWFSRRGRSSTSWRRAASGQRRSGRRAALRAGSELRAGSNGGGAGSARWRACRNGQPPSRGSLLHPAGEGARRGIGGVNSARGGVGALLECDFSLSAPTFRVGVE
jgi:hypothetical protein